MSNKNYDVQSIYLDASKEVVFDFIADPTNLSRWTQAFKKADKNSALLVTPKGELQIGLETRAERESGTIDWLMKMPDGSIGTAFSRVVEVTERNSIYSFILMAPPVPLEEVEGTLAAQKEQLSEELEKLKEIIDQ